MATFLQQRLAATEKLIAEAEDAQSKILTGAIMSYTIDTGQSRSTVTKHNITELNRMIDSLYSRWATLNARINGTGATISRPYF